MPDIITQSSDPVTTLQQQQTGVDPLAKTREELENQRAQVSVQNQATEAERQAPPVTPIDTQIVKSANDLTNNFNSYILGGGDIGKLDADTLYAVVNGASYLPP